jgi:hypothetical protein
MLDSGFSLFDSICELVDNSLSAGAKTIRLSINTRDATVIVSDDGSGMTLEELCRAFILHIRSNSSDTKHGRFGIGGNHAHAEITQLGKVKIITKSDEASLTSGLSELDLDYAWTVAEDGRDLIIRPGKIAYDSKPLWDENAINRSKRGTVIIMNAAQSVICKLRNAMVSTNVTESLRYHIATTYNHIIADGVHISLHLDNDAYLIHAIDPLCKEIIEEENTRTTNIEIWSNNETGEKRAYYCTPEQEEAYRDFTRSAKGKQVKGSPPTNGTWTKKGSIVLKNAYSPEWVEHQRECLTSIGLVVPQLGGDGIQDVLKELNGRYILRNNKVIARFDTPPRKAGDKAAYKYYDNSRSVISFRASEFMDNCFKVMTNKSKLDESLFDPIVSRTINALCNAFANDMYSMVKNDGETVHTVESEHSAQTDAEPDDDIVVAPIVPIPRPPPAHGFTFTSGDGFGCVCENETEICRMVIHTPFHVWRDYLQLTLLSVGEDRFRQWVTAISVPNNTILR